jgi:hypothetical protein
MPGDLSKLIECSRCGAVSRVYILTEDEVAECDLWEVLEPDHDLVCPVCIRAEDVLLVARSPKIGSNADDYPGTRSG